MVGFAGYEMPVQYPTGIIAEHLHTRSQAGLFDVSHMGQIGLRGVGTASALEALVPGDLQALAPRRMRYTLLLNDAGGILDDLMVTRVEDGLMLVVNAACKEADLAHLQARFDRSVTIEPRFERALLALQGPAAATVLARFAGGVERMPFMSAAELSIAGVPCSVTRSGYTGEDGFEISLASDHAMGLAERLLAEPEVAPIGLGARDTLRLEAGLCLYGHDIDETTTPIEAGLAWTIGKRRQTGGGFPGAAIILRQLAEGPARKRVGIRPDSRAPARTGPRLSMHRRFGQPSHSGASARRSARRRDGHVVLSIARRAPRSPSSSAMSRGRRMSHRCPLSRHVITALQELQYERRSLHQGSRMGPPRGRPRRDRHYRLRAVAAG
jgi:aminomethyltransferase